MKRVHRVCFQIDGSRGKRPLRALARSAGFQPGVGGQSRFRSPFRGEGTRAPNAVDVPIVPAPLKGLERRIGGLRAPG